MCALSFDFTRHIILAARRRGVLLFLLLCG